MATDLITKAELIANMRESARRFLEAARALPSERWSEGCYEEGWTAKDILAHVASIEWTYPKLLVLAAQPDAEDRDAEGRFRGGIGDYNQRRVDERRDRSVEELLIRSCADFGITAGRAEGLPGVWVGRDKIAAIGVRIAKWVTSHTSHWNESVSQLRWSARRPMAKVPG